ncbi:hypothetical protein Leryth_027473, partial [Lithospermum erythrorhizon]
MLSPPPISNPQLPTLSPGNSFVHNILSYDSNMMLAAIITLLLVILFVLLLHVYAKWYLVQSARRRGTGGSVSVPGVMLSARYHHHFHTFSVGMASASSPTKGLEASIISLIPQFIYQSVKGQQEMECVICLCVFENGEVGRKLPECEHEFHVDCIDMWLHSHTTCPVCRSPAICDNKWGNPNVDDRGLSEVAMEELEIVVVEGTIESNENVDTKDTSSSSGDSLKKIMSPSG